MPRINDPISFSVGQNYHPFRSNDQCFVFRKPRVSHPKQATVICSINLHCIGGNVWLIRFVWRLVTREQIAHPLIGCAVSPCVILLDAPTELAIVSEFILPVVRHRDADEFVLIIVIQNLVPVRPQVPVQVINIGIGSRQIGNRHVRANITQIVLGNRRERVRPVGQGEVRRGNPPGKILRNPLAFAWDENGR
jgi:hypothetical protein